MDVSTYFSSFEYKFPSLSDELDALLISYFSTWGAFFSFEKFLYCKSVN